MPFYMRDTKGQCTHRKITMQAVKVGRALLSADKLVEVGNDAKLSKKSITIAPWFLYVSIAFLYVSFPTHI